MYYVSCIIEQALIFSGEYTYLKKYSIGRLNNLNVGRLRFELRTSRLKAGCSTAELATHFVKLSTLEIIPFKGKKNNLLFKVEQ